MSESASKAEKDEKKPAAGDRIQIKYDWNVK
jgi:hypothetical protein